MNSRIATVLIVIVSGGVTMALGNKIWPPAPGMPVPTAAQLPFFIGLAVAESLAFGLGIAFIILGMPLVRRASGLSRGLGWAVYLSIAWLLVSWWPHDSLHRHNGENSLGLLYIEYGFHVTLIVAGLVLAYAYVKLLRRASRVPEGMVAGRKS